MNSCRILLSPASVVEQVWTHTSFLCVIHSHFKQMWCQDKPPKSPCHEIGISKSPGFTCLRLVFSTFLWRHWEVNPGPFRQLPLESLFIRDPTSNPWALLGLNCKARPTASWASHSILEKQRLKDKWVVLSIRGYRRYRNSIPSLGSLPTPPNHPKLCLSFSLF